MKPSENNFTHWKRQIEREPDAVIDAFFQHLEDLPTETRRAIIASANDRDTIVSNIGSLLGEDSKPLQGVPYLLQDLFDVKNLPTRCGAPFSEPFEHLVDESSALDLALKKGGAVLLGKTIPSEFGVSPKGHNTTFGNCPHSSILSLTCGGGSGTSAYAVKQGWAPLAFGLDSSAGIRIPAAFHGLFGFRMANNDYARKGVFPIVTSIESVGFLTSHHQDLQTTIEFFHPRPEVPDKATPRGHLMEEPTIPLAPELKTGMMRLVRHLDIDDAPDINQKLRKAFNTSGEAFSIIQSRELYSIHQYWVEEYRSHYDEALLRLIEAGQMCPPEKADMAEAIQLNIREAMAHFFKDHDYLAIPICSHPTPDKTKWSGPLENDLLRLNAPTGLSFLPALILPFPCSKNRHGAIQLILNPRKIHLTAAILEQVSSFYETSA